MAVRVAVAVGHARVRLAVASDDDEPRIVAVLPAERFDLSELLAEVVGPPPDELVLVHAAIDEPHIVAAMVARAGPLAHAVRAVSVPVAAAVGTAAVAVLDVGHTGAVATHLVDGRSRVVEVGGAALDAVLGVAPAIREELSIHPFAGGLSSADAAAALAPVLERAVDALRTVLDGCGGPVLLIGGVARTPLLAELVDAAGIGGAVVAARPEAAAVLGALRTAGVDGPGRPRRAEPEPRPLLPPPPRRRVGRAVAGAVAATVAAALLLGAGAAIEPTAPASGELVQYGYRIELPAGWEHSGGLPERRRTLLTPVAAPRGSDLVTVESSPLGYDAGAEPERAAAELRAVYDDGLARGLPLSGYTAGASVAGRPVTTFRQDEPGGVRTDWYVLLDGDAQLSVGCRHTPAGASASAAVCALVLGSLQRT